MKAGLVSTHHPALPKVPTEHLVRWRREGVGQTHPAQETVYGNGALPQVQANGDRGVLAVAPRAPVAVPHNFVETEPGQGSEAEDEAARGAAKRLGCPSGEVVEKVRAKGKGCVKSSQATSEVDPGGERSCAHLLHSSTRECSGRSDDAGLRVTYRTIWAGFLSAALHCLALDTYSFNVVVHS